MSGTKTRDRHRDIIAKNGRCSQCGATEKLNYARVVSRRDGGIGLENNRRVICTNCQLEHQRQFMAEPRNQNSCVYSDGFKRIARTSQIANTTAYGELTNKIRIAQLAYNQALCSAFSQWIHDTKPFVHELRAFDYQKHDKNFMDIKEKWKVAFRQCANLARKLNRTNDVPVLSRERVEQVKP